MIHTLAIANYRSLRHLVVPLGRLNVITGANGSGKTNLYRALRLLADTAQGGVIAALAREGGLDSTPWAGPKLRPSALLADRRVGLVRLRSPQGEWEIARQNIALFESMLTEVVDANRAPEVLSLRDQVRSWRFYDHFRVDPDAPARQPQ